jgi:hypothetical protein
VTGTIINEGGGECETAKHSFQFRIYIIRTLSRNVYGLYRVRITAASHGILTDFLAFSSSMYYGRTFKHVKNKTSQNNVTVFLSVYPLFRGPGFDSRRC